MTTVSRIIEHARRRHGVITLAELYELGCTESAVRHLVATSRLVRVHRGVYALEGPLSPQGRALAAVLACGPRCTLSHLSAAAHHGYRSWWPRRPEVTTARRNNGTGPSGVLLRRSSTLTRADVLVVDQVPTTSTRRTVIDCAPLLSMPQLKSLVWSAEQAGLDLHTLDVPGIPRRLRELLDEYVPGAGLTTNELEARFFELCARAGLPRPEIQASFPERRRVDFVWHDLRLIVETDGRRSHDTAIAFLDDRRRDRAHLLAGYVTMRFTWAEVRHEPETVARDLAAAIASRRAQQPQR